MKRMALRSRGSRSDAIEYALRLLSYRSRSRSELIQRLCKGGFGRAESEKTVRYLKERGFIEDRTLAGELYRNAVERRVLGRIGIRAFLGRRGIEKDLIDETLSVHTTDIDRESALRFVMKRVKTLQGHPQDVKKRRIRGALQRRGFSAEIIRSVIESVW